MLHGAPCISHRMSVGTRDRFRFSRAGRFRYSIFDNRKCSYMYVFKFYRFIPRIAAPTTSNTTYVTSLLVLLKWLYLEFLTAPDRVKCDA